MPDPLAQLRAKLKSGSSAPAAPAQPRIPAQPSARDDYESFGFGSPRKPAGATQGAPKAASLEEIRKALKAGQPVAKEAKIGATVNIRRPPRYLKPVPLAKGAHKPPRTHLSGLKTPEQVAQLIESLSGMHPTERMYALYAAGAADARIHDDTYPR